MDRIIRHWNISNGCIEKISETTWYISDGYVLKEYCNKKALDRNIRFIKLLKQRNIPVAQIIPDQNGADHIKEGEKYYLLTERLKGKNAVSVREWDGLPYQIGKITGTLHKAFLDIPIDDEIWKNSLSDEMQGWIFDNFANDNWKTIAREQYEEVLFNLKKYYDVLPKQLIHRDVHLGNFLFSDGRFSGYIDFDLSQTNIRIFDVCYFLSGLPAGKENRIDTAEWLCAVKDTISGYDSIMNLTAEEYSAIPYVMQSIELLFISYSLGANDTDLLKQSKECFDLLKGTENELKALFESDKNIHSVNK